MPYSSVLLLLLQRSRSVVFSFLSFPFVHAFQSTVNQNGLVVSTCHYSTGHNTTLFSCNNRPTAKYNDQQLSNNSFTSTRSAFYLVCRTITRPSPPSPVNCNTNSQFNKEEEWNGPLVCWSASFHRSS